MLLLTDACNLDCAYCYRGKKSNSQSMPFEIAEEVLIWAGASKDYFHVQLTGGEPLLYPELIEKIAKFIYDNEEMFSKLKQHNIASLLNIKPETLSRKLKKFKELGIIENIGSKLKVKNKEKIKEFFKW